MTDPLLNMAAISPLKNDGTAHGTGSPNAAKIRESAEEFEAVFLSQMLTTMTQELGGAGGVAGEGGDVYRDMFTQEVAKMISRSGGIGIADSILQEMLKIQEID